MGARQSDTKSKINTTHDLMRGDACLPTFDFTSNVCLHFDDLHLHYII